MKPQILRTALVTLFALLLFAGCAKSEPEPTPTTSKNAIRAVAAIKRSVEVDTKAPLDNAPADGLKAYVHAWKKQATSLAGNMVISGTMTFNAGTGVDDQVTFDPGYRGENRLPYKSSIPIKAHYPAEGWSLAESCSYKFTGCEDVMTSKTLSVGIDAGADDQGNPTTETAAFELEHCLTRFEIKVKAENDEIQKQWGRIKSIELKHANAAAFYDKWHTYSNDYSLGGNTDRSNATLTRWPTYEIAAPSSYKDTKFAFASFADMYVLNNIATPVCYTMTFPYSVAGTTYTNLMLEITTVNKEGGAEVKTDVVVDLNPASLPSKNPNSSYETSGVAFAINLTFKANKIEPTTEVTDWKRTGSGSADVGVLKTPKVGDYYYSDGSYSTALEVGKTATGMIYYIDPADPHKYKVMSLEEDLTTMKWAAAETYVVSGARSDVDGKANSAAIKAAFDANVAGAAIAQQTFAAAFPAAAYCYNYRGMGGTDAVGSWYLPAKRELQYLWCSYNGVAPRGWADGPNSAGAPANTTAQATWNTRITVGGARAGITGNYFWSSTETSSNASDAWCVDFSNGSTDGKGKSYDGYVRCVRDITPLPAIGSLMGGGIAYSVDESSTKVLSLDEGSTLMWAAKRTYVIGYAGQNLTDGKANVAAMKAYSSNNINRVDASERTTGNFATDFPAAHFCDSKNTGDITGWYLPARDELMALSSNYLTNKTVIDAGLLDNSGTAIAASGSYWSSTEGTYGFDNGAFIVFISGHHQYTYNDTETSVRCVREL